MFEYAFYVPVLAYALGWIMGKASGKLIDKAEYHKGRESAFREMTERME